MKDVSDEAEEEKLSEEEQELIEIYGQKIRMLRWYFENDKIVQQQAKKKKDFGNLNEYYDEEDEEVEQDKDFEFFNGFGYTGLNEENTKIVEDSY